MNRADMIKRQLDKAGRTVYFKDNNWMSTPFCACISPLWRKKTANFEPKYTELGQSFREYYLYTGPYDHDVTELSDEAMVIFGKDKFEIKCADAVVFSDEIIYYTAILKKLKGENGFEN
ncbi:MAG: hypothetical protein K2L19_04405 [Eubacterium sp.]|nr:hypothetical protein [Eubacterium sp.]